VSVALFFWPDIPVTALTYLTNDSNVFLFGPIFHWVLDLSPTIRAVVSAWLPSLLLTVANLLVVPVIAFLVSLVGLRSSPRRALGFQERGLGSQLPGHGGMRFSEDIFHPVNIACYTAMFDNRAPACSLAAVHATLHSQHDRPLSLSARYFHLGQLYMAPNSFRRGTRFGAMTG